ncbi:MAG: ABC transporter permease [Variibacter sp.]|uniref:ABC transporter permease n=1 Tax=Pseudorhodoplanes sp. TaxID=1934341 RepID=UPI003D12A9C0
MTSQARLKRDIAKGGEIVPAPELPDVFPPQRTLTGLAGLVWRHKAVCFGIFITLAMILIAVFAPYLTKHDPSAIAPMTRLRPPSAEHYFGTDMLGRDIYARVIYGTRVSLSVGFVVAILSSGVGLFIGLLSGYFRWLDGPIMRLMDGVMSIPGVLLAIAMMALSGGSLGTVIAAITVVEIPRVARLVRGVALSIREQAYVEAAIAAGTSTPKIMYRHILPNTMAPLMVQATYVCAAAMLLESILSFIGAGIPPSVPSWGNIMADGRALWQIKPAIIFIPAVALSITILAINLVGDGLRDALDPRMARKV